MRWQRARSGTCPPRLPRASSHKGGSLLAIARAAASEEAMWLGKVFAACDNQAPPFYGRDYVRRNRAELGALLKIADGSKMLADFRRLGPYQRLKSLYVQRWALKRRLAGMRVSKPA